MRSSEPSEGASSRNRILLRQAYRTYALIIWKFFGKMKPVKAAFHGQID